MRSPRKEPPWRSSPVGATALERVAETIGDQDGTAFVLEADLTDAGQASDAVTRAVDEIRRPRRARGIGRPPHRAVVDCSGCPIEWRSLGGAGLLCFRWAAQDVR